jgi:uncharacterized protein
VRRAPKSDAEVGWHPERGELDLTALHGVDAVVCLSGAQIGPKVLLPGYRRTIVSSRIEPTALLARALGKAPDGPRTFLAASGSNYYGDSGDRVVEEDEPAGDTFLADVCVAWERAAAPAAEAGVRVVRMRTGPVLSGRGGLLPALRPIARLGIAGRLGSGRQFLPWISLEDHVAAMRFLLEHRELSGAVNLSGPAPARNADFIAAIARQVHRPSVVPVPGLILRTALGRDLAQDLLGGQRAIPAKLAAAGFSFRHPTLESALAAAG